MRILAKSPAKQSEVDPAPTWLIQRSSTVLALVVTAICSASFEQVVFPCSCKKAVVRPLLNKCSSDADDPSSYWPISNLSFLSKVTDKAVDARLSSHIGSNRLLPLFQSIYHPFHSTETAFISILNDMIAVVNQGCIGALMLLDLSAAFHMVDHTVLIEMMKTRFGVDGDTLRWVTDFLSNRSQSVHARDVKSEESALHFGVPQGSMLCPRTFNQYAEDVSKLFSHHHLCHHLLADDMQCHCSGRPAEAPSMVSLLQRCIADVSIWCASR